MKIKPIVDFLYAMKIRPAEVTTAAGTVVQPPSQPAFSIAGRAPQSLQRLLAAWHAELGRRLHTGRCWKASGCAEFHLCEAPQGDDGEAARWRLAEILHGSELRDEGRALHHCVASYEWRCLRGTSSIWSLRRQSGEGPPQPRYTVEVDPQTRTIVQIRGYQNCRASGQPRRILDLWAERERLTLPEHA